MKTWRLSLLILSVSLLLGAGALLLWANIPPKIETEIYHLHLVPPGIWDTDSALEISSMQYTLAISYPTRLNTGQVGKCLVEMNGLPETVFRSHVREQIWIKAELVTPGITNRQEGVFTEIVQSGAPLQFTWELQAQTPRQVAGILRIFAVYGASIQGGSTQLLSISEVPISIRDVAGLNTSMATIVAVVLILLAGFAGAIGWSQPRTDSR